MSDMTPSERPEERDSLSALEYRDRLAAMAEIFNNETARLEAEVKELWEKLDAATAPYPEAFEAGRQAARRIKQMEEALREAERRARDVLPTAKSTGSTAMLSFVQYVRDLRKTIARTALSPSDTEKPRSWGIGSWRCPNCGEVNISEKCSECEFPRPSDTEEEA